MKERRPAPACPHGARCAEALRRQNFDRLLLVADSVEAGIPLISAKELNAEIQAYRMERRRAEGLELDAGPTPRVAPSVGAVVVPFPFSDLSRSKLRIAVGRVAIA